MAAIAGKNAIANLIGSLATPLIGLVMTPFYLRKIGLEGLGLVGLMTLITIVLGVFVAGASKTYQRDISAAQISAPEDVSGLVKGGMLVFVTIGIATGLLVAIFGFLQITSIGVGNH